MAHYEEQSPEISIIIVTWNSQATISSCLNSLRSVRNEAALEIIVVDNASSDQTKEILGNYPEIILLENLDNLGFCAANNIGIHKAKGEFILLLNPDAFLMPGFFHAALAVMKANPNTALVAGKVLRADNSGTPVFVDGKPIIDTTGIRLLRNRQAVDRGQGEPDHGQYDQVQEVFGVSGAVCFCRAEALRQVAVNDQVFDEAFFAYKEDVDLSWRLRNLGWVCSYTPDAVAYHARGWQPSLKLRAKIPAAVRFHSFKNRRLSILKNDTLKGLLSNLLPILWFEFLALGYVLIREPFLLKAYLDIVRQIPQIRRWRRAIFQAGNNASLKKSNCLVNR